MDDNELHSLEYGPYSWKNGLHPFHIDSLERAAHLNLRRCYNEQYWENTWVLIFAGTFDECVAFSEKFQKRLIREGKWEVT